MENGNSIFDDKISEWHNDSETKLSLYEYLGLTLEEFKIWLRFPNKIEKDICQCKKKSEHQLDSGVCVKCGKRFIS